MVLSGYLMYVLPVVVCVVCALVSESTREFLKPGANTGAKWQWALNLIADLRRQRVGL
jgi:hypothetical protein